MREIGRQGKKSMMMRKRRLVRIRTNEVRVWLMFM
jgi:hypothetical protein